MASSAHRRQVVLFLLAVLLPCLVLVVLSLRMIRQEQELAEKRVAEEQRRLVSQIRQELLARLERIKFQEVSALARKEGKARAHKYVNPAVVLVGRVENNRLVLPWEVNRTTEKSRRLLGEAKFARKIQRGEREELVRKRFAQAVGLYREAMEAARHPVQAAYARLLLARVLAKLGQRRKARAHYRKILSLPSEVTDEHDLPLSLYAGAHLLEAGVGHQAVLERIRAEVNAQHWLPPAEAYLLRGLLETLVESAHEATIRDAAKELERRMAGHIRYLEQALALQSDFSKLRLIETRTGQSRSPEPLWIPYGEENWLVSVAPALGALRPAVVAVRAEEIFASLDVAGAGSNSFSGQVQFFTGRESKGEFLGPNLPGLKVAFAAKDDGTLAKKWNLQRSFYFVTLLLILSVALFGAYLVWRDVRRELRLAELRSQFVSSVSHELKTPLTAIRMFAETLRMGRSSDQQTQDEYLETIVNESERLTRLLNNVLDFSKIEQGQKIYRLQPTSLAEIVHRAARTMRYPLAQQGFQLHVNVQDGMPTLRVDADALEQAILNLLANAMKYSGESREIDLRLRTQEDQAVIQVTDRGVGIPPKEKTRIFDKFYRIPTPENRLIPGTGLGLTLVAHIAQAHGGHVEVQSPPGEGSTFSIHFPLEREA